MACGTNGFVLTKSKSEQLLQHLTYLRINISAGEKSRYAEIMGILGGWVAAGQLRHRSHVFDGLDRAPQALNAMFTGENIGKVVIKVS